MVARSDGDKYPRRRGIGVELGRLRRDAGRTEGDAAAFLDCPSGRISRIEQGLAAIRVGETKALLDFYRVAGDRRDGLIAKVRRARDRCWWLPYGDQIDDSFETQLILEADASALRTYQPNLVPGLLQTERYATELIETQADLPLTEVRKQASLRVLRQQVLTRGNPPTLSVVLDEAVLRRPVGSRDVMREQYAVLAESAGTPGVTVQVLPFRAGPITSLDSVSTSSTSVPRSRRPWRSSCSIGCASSRSRRRWRTTRTRSDARRPRRSACGTPGCS